jgi:tetratricopeptide (TPR) repeat protein
VREKIVAALKKRANNPSPCVECACLAVGQVAYCYKIGFGVERDEQQAKEWRDELRARLDLLPDPRVIFRRVQADVESSGCECTGGPAALSLEGLIAAGFLDFNLAEQLLQDVPMEVAIQKVAAEGAARALEFGDDDDSALYYKLLLSILYTQSGNVDKARELQLFVYDAVQQGQAEAGNNNSNLRTVSELLADTLRQSGDLTNAKALQADLVRDTRQAHGTAHPELFRVTVDLAHLLADDGDYESAERYQKDAIEGLKKLYGEAHHVTVQAMANLVSIYRYAGKLEEAESLARRSLALSERLSGTTHTRTLGIRAKLGVLAYDREQYDEADRHLRPVFEEYCVKLGMREERTLVTATALVALYMKQGRDVEAEQLLEDVMRHNANTLGPGSGLVASYRGDLAVLRERGGDWAGAETLYLDLIQDMTGRHPDLLAPQSNLALFYLNRGDIDAAEVWQRRALESATRFLAAPHVKLATVQFNTAVLWIKLHRYEEAEKLLCDVVGQWEALLGPESTGTKNGQAWLDEARRLIAERRSLGLTRDQGRGGMGG